MAWFVDVSALPAQSVPEDAPGIANDAPAVAPVSDGIVEALTAHIADLQGQLSAQSTAHADAIAQLREAHTEEIARLIDAHAREVATLRDVNRDQFVILERLSVPRLADSQSTAPRPWWRIW
jgi:selenocysteine lyase/cysteine desulfurase